MHILGWRKLLEGAQAGLSWSIVLVLWPLERGYPTLFVPTSAVTTDQQHTFVIRVQDNKAEWVTVRTGQTVEGEIEVFGDLKTGDCIIQIGYGRDQFRGCGASSGRQVSSALIPIQT